MRCRTWFRCSHRAAFPPRSSSSPRRSTGAYEFWWDAVDRVLLSSPAVPARLELQLAGELLDVPTATRAQRLAARAAILERLYPLEHEERAAAIGALARWGGAGLAGDPARRPMTADEVARFAARPGVTIGAHSQHHEQLPRLTHEAKLADLRTCRSRLESLIGRPVTALSYPYGFADDDTVEAAREAGFELAVTTEARGLTRRLRSAAAAAIGHRRFGTGGLQGRARGTLARRLRSSVFSLQSSDLPASPGFAHQTSSELTTYGLLLERVTKPPNLNVVGEIA